MKYDAVIFDCDGVLVDSESLGLEASAAYLSMHGLNWTPAELVRLFTGLRDDVFAARLAEAYRGAHGIDPSPDFFEGLIAERRKRRHELQPVAGAAQTLARLEGPKAVASSSRAVYLESKLKRTGLWPYVAPHVYSGELVAQGKPEPDIFLYAADKLRTPPASCLVVEDSANGVAAGRAAGMTVCGFIGGAHCFEGHDKRLREAGAHFIADDFAALSEMLRDA